jgi:lysozyme
MNISPQGLELLMAREGKRNEVYRDTQGVLTVGYGHTGPDVVEGEIWTDERIEEAFAKDLERFEVAINAATVGVPVEQNQFDALVSFAYNVGTNAAASSTLIRRVNEGNIEGATNEFDRWHIPPEITSRRNGEKAQFMGTAYEARID